MKKTNEKDPTYKTTIGAQFEYNRFTRDFSKIQIIKEKQKLMRLLAWNEMKAKPGAMFMFSKVEN